MSLLAAFWSKSVFFMNKRVYITINVYYLEELDVLKIDEEISDEVILEKL